MIPSTIYFDLFGVLLGWGISGFRELKTTELLENLSKNYNLWIISNTSNRQINSLKSKFDFFQYFNGIITSESAGEGKPDSAIFVHALKTADTTPGDSLFIDDSLKNIQSANSLGIKTHHYRSHLKLLQYLEDECLMPLK